MGSEHRINGLPFPAEVRLPLFSIDQSNVYSECLFIQLYGFNSDLYHNMSEARHKSQGIVGVAILVQVGDKSNEELRILTSSFNKVIFRGQKAKVHHLNIRQLLPDTEKYMTYEGSTTYPGCWETTTWVIFNKPIYMTRQEMYALRKVMQGDEELPKAPLGNNVRPLQPLHHRTCNPNHTNGNVGIGSISINFPVTFPRPRSMNTKRLIPRLESIGSVPMELVKEKKLSNTLRNSRNRE
ncbi:unnamed protein product [Darwinula stevensoni]|nr:unnamed protein product [Darwinula stevensoni]CAG0891090.1 unnamed protein product [Darwinula stevensoni]